LRPPKPFARKNTAGPKRKQPEARLQRIVNRSLKLAYPGQVKVRDTEPEHDHATGKQSAKNKGRPDIIGSIMGLHVEIELKVSPRHPTSEQMIEMRQACHAGALAMMIVHHTIEDTYWLINWNQYKNNFSWRHRTDWIRLQTYVDDKLTFISMNALHSIILPHIAQLKTKITG